MKKLFVVLTLLLAIAAALFYRQVWAIFSGMSPLESMKMIVNFLLHVAVATVIGYAAMTLPEFVKPWLRAFRQSSMQAFRNRSRQAKRRGQQVEARTTLPRSASNKDQALAWLVNQMASSSPSAFGISPKRRSRLGETGNEEPTIRLDL